MIVAPFDLSSRPAVAARAARASRAALSIRAVLPDSWGGELPPLGAATVAIGGVRWGGDGQASADPVFAVWRGTTPGRLSVDAVFASQLVDAVLSGRDAVRAARALGPAERGVLAGVLAGLFGTVGWSLGLGPVGAFSQEAVAQEAVAHEAVALVLDVDTPIGLGRVAVQWPPAALGGSSAALVARLGRLPITAPLVIAATQLRAAEIAGVRPGDAVVFDGVRAEGFAHDASWPAGLELGVGERYWPVTVDGGGHVTVAGKLEARREEDRMGESGNTMDADLTAALAAAPIEVVAELGRVTLRGEELAGLAPGAVLTLGASRAVVALRVGGERWAEGEIVNVEGELGVRITRVLGR
jgi:type III secretion system YscQ/HrcQ family protein